MDQDYTEDIEDAKEETVEEKSFGREIAESLAIGLVSGAASFIGFVVIGNVIAKVEAFRAHRAAKKEASEVVVETEESETTNTEE